jgi:hypothetical protein
MRGKRILMDVNVVVLINDALWPFHGRHFDGIHISILFHPHGLGLQSGNSSARPVWDGPVANEGLDCLDKV